MRTLRELVTFISGSPQFRIQESLATNAPRYVYYGQSDLMDDLMSMRSIQVDSKEVRTKDEVHTLSYGNVVFSLITGQATIVRRAHDGYLYTQNYIKLLPTSTIDAGFLVYLLNEDKSIRKQFFIGLQGSQVLKYTLQQLKEIRIEELPPLDRQQQIGELYLKQLHLTALKNRVVELEKIVCLANLAEAGRR
ncbi:restriction endonuclease subunit S [Pectinatus frisingensis]|uniref:restriction endonuclease subunit S n=1 Tax=Pectinatus frisingensis TaxID=865 RepID=UPI0018C797A0|nr:restriction endonuclease subunit S [Pectinatus frisingensis]